MNRVCKRCKVELEDGMLHRRQIVNSNGPDVILLGCPCCGNVLDAYAEVEARKDPYAVYLPTVDECTYTIHCLQKQEAKLQHALGQVHGTITKLEVLRELAKEQEKE